MIALPARFAYQAGRSDSAPGHHACSCSGGIPRHGSSHQHAGDRYSRHRAMQQGGELGPDYSVVSHSGSEPGDDS